MIEKVFGVVILIFCVTVRAYSDTSDEVVSCQFENDTTLDSEGYMNALLELSQPQFENYDGECLDYFDTCMDYNYTSPLKVMDGNTSYELTAAIVYTGSTSSFELINSTYYCENDTQFYLVMEGFVQVPQVLYDINAQLIGNDNITVNATAVNVGTDIKVTWYFARRDDDTYYNAIDIVDSDQYGVTTVTLKEDESLSEELKNNTLSALEYGVIQACSNVMLLAGDILYKQLENLNISDYMNDL